MISSLLVLRLSNNLLNGSIPNSLGMLSSLQVLDLSNNQFSGSLPDELSELTKVWFSLTASQKID
jgi:Leucine-rich repeat (LRR) protein